jgi:phenylacetate-coenzyme A ligase PaaK-like adenylate-forming protein
VLQNFQHVFSIQSADFIKTALSLFCFQFETNSLYREFAAQLNRTPDNVKRLEDIPFLPIEFFKTHKVVCKDTGVYDEVFLSSGTTGMEQSRHFVKDINYYINSFEKSFRHFVGNPEEMVIIALLPSYLERKGSSLIYMMEYLIKKSTFNESGFYLHNLDELADKLIRKDAEGKKVLLLGVSFALLDLIEQYQFKLNNTIVMETGGMKGRRKELVREELHEILCRGFGVNKIWSEYGMTELLSQAYSKGDGIFETPPWMKILIRDVNDPFFYLPNGRTGGINVIDLANVNSCAFIATKDLGKIHNNGNFEVLGRFDNSDIRGCNLLIA